MRVHRTSRFAIVLGLASVLASTTTAKADTSPHRSPARVTAPAEVRPVVTPEEAAALFTWLAQQKDIAFDYPWDGCYARAHLMARRLRARGYEPGKVWAFANHDNLHVSIDPKHAVEWKYHVAPTLRVRIPNGTIQVMVLDPSMFSWPVHISEWSAAQKKYTRSHPYITVTRFGQAPILPNGVRAPGSGYWPTSDPPEGLDANARKTMKHYLARPKR
jgi:hypothetical protein